MEGLIPFTSAILYPNIEGYFLNTCNNFSVSVRPNSALTITGLLSSLSRNSYLRVFGNGLRSEAGCFGQGIWLGVKAKHSLKLSSRYSKCQLSSLKSRDIGIFITSE